MAKIIPVKNFIYLAAIFLFSSYNLAFADNAAYNQRKSDYVDASLVSPSGAKIVLQAFRGVPVDTNILNAVLALIPTKSTCDFDIIELVRILYLDSATYDAQILPVINSVPYWINNYDTVRGYWSENHMIMWMSSDWLLHERYGRSIDTNLRPRLKHYLELKIQYGFYEFFSTTYLPFTLSGLLNLADFCEDPELKNLATQAAQKLLTNLLMMTNDKGVCYPAAGRNFPGRYVEPYNQNNYHLIYLLTGMGVAPQNASGAGSFLASSSISLDDVINSWTPDLDTIYSMGHTLDSGFVINSAMSTVDKTVFQWSSGGYFHPLVSQSTVQLFIDSNLWNHVDFALFAPLVSIVTPQSAPTLSETLSVISKSTVICGQDLAIYKKNEVVLSSVLDFWKGKVGFQQFPCVANVGTTAVYTASGEVKTDWGTRNSKNANVHLPYVEQQKNVSLIMYRPEPTPEIIGPAFTFKDVALHWVDADFDEVINDNLWLIGRQNQGYVAVRRSCDGTIDGVRACPTTNGQTWVIMVGDSAMHGSFSNFQNIVNQSLYEEQWYLDSISGQYVYYAKISVDSITIDYAWGVDSLSSGVENLQAQSREWTLSPNPANETIQVGLKEINEPILIQICNMNGQIVYSYSGSQQVISIPTESLANGVYALKKVAQNSISSKKFIVQHE